MNCRHCDTELRSRFVDLGTAPRSNAYLTAEQLSSPENWYPLRVMVCEGCWLLQTEDDAHAEDLFSPDYAYFSSFSTTWLKHAERFVTEAVRRFELGPESLLVEVAANDGYLLQYVQQCGIRCYGVEPTAATAAAARKRGIEITEEFFGRRLARELASERGLANLMVANNVLAHTPDINDFVAGFAILLEPNGVAVFEIPYLLRLVAENQFDTIYHEHFSYLSLTSVEHVFKANGLAVFDVERLVTHGGSLRLFAQRSDTGQRPVSNSVRELLQHESDVGLKSLSYYQGFQTQAERIKDDFLQYLLDAKRAGRKVAAYGAAAKGNTFLNFAGIRADLIPFVVDRNPEKQGKYLPGSRIPIVGEDYLTSQRPDDIVILPWNLKDEVIQQLAYASRWNATFVTAIPSLCVHRPVSWKRQFELKSA
ncbi:MAG TPA: class I SAM-dependent methyltransferase [Pirellulaceae bacterium]|nr:class I SAM-dependent methyltransferase [Pirellulaceae bacterium]